MFSFAFCLLWPAAAMSVRRPGRAPEVPKPLLMLRLGHSGSSWFTQMLSEQEDTYITREAIFPITSHGPIRLQWKAMLENMTVDEVVSYFEKALRVPSGNMAMPNEVQLYDYEEFDSEPDESTLAPAPDALASSLLQVQSGNPRTLACLREQGQRCALKYLGLAVDPNGTGLAAHADEVFARVSGLMPELPVIVYRRSNIVKRALAKGGLSGPTAALNVTMNVSRFLRRVRKAAEQDHLLLRAARHFPHRRLVSYEQLQAEPARVMPDVFSFLGMTEARVTDEILDNGKKTSPEDLRLMLANFEELSEALRQRSPCLAEQMAALTNQDFPQPCPLFTI